MYVSVVHVFTCLSILILISTRNRFHSQQIPLSVSNVHLTENHLQVSQSITRIRKNNLLMIDGVWLIVGVGPVSDFLCSKQTSDTCGGGAGRLTGAVDYNYNVGSGGCGIIERDGDL